jgi:hypothetical protein
MWNLTLQHLHIRRLYISMLIILVLALALGAIVGIYWRDDYAQCLARVGGLEKVLNGMCVSLP